MQRSEMVGFLLLPRFAKEANAAAYYEKIMETPYLYMEDDDRISTYSFGAQLTNGRRVMDLPGKSHLSGETEGSILH